MAVYVRRFGSESEYLKWAKRAGNRIQVVRVVGTERRSKAIRPVEVTYETTDSRLAPADKNLQRRELVLILFILAMLIVWSILERQAK